MATPGQVVVADRSMPRARAERRSAFFVLTAAALAIVIYTGFAPTFYLRSWFNVPPQSSILVVAHGVAFSLWPALLLIQTLLVATARTPLHRTLGVVGVVVAAAMVVLGAVVTVEQVQRGIAVGFPPGISPVGFLFALGEISIVGFAGLVGAAVHFRRRPETHKRLMIAATALISVAGIVRLLPLALGSYASTLSGMQPVLLAMLLADLFIVALAIHDVFKLKRIHPATLWAAAVTAASQALTVLLGSMPSFAAAVTWLLV